MSQLNDWHKQILDTLVFLQRPAAGLVAPPGGGGRERLELLADVRRLLAPEDHAVEPWKATLQRWAGNLADCHRSYVLESLHALAQSIDVGIAAALGSSTEEWIRSGDFPAIRFFARAGPVLLAAGLLSAGHKLLSFVPDPFILEGQRVLVLGFALPGLPWRERPFYPCDLAKRLTTDHRRVQAEAEAAEQQRYFAERARERWEGEHSPQGQIEGLRKRLAALENATKR